MAAGNRVTIIVIGHHPQTTDVIGHPQALLVIGHQTSLVISHPQTIHCITTWGVVCEL